MVEDFTRRVADAQCGAGNSDLMRAAREYILLHLDKSITTQELPRAMGMNRTYLCRRFQEEIGMTVNHYDTAVKMDDSSQSYFQSVFKKAAGVTPGEYRRKSGRKDYP